MTAKMRHLRDPQNPIEWNVFVVDSAKDARHDLNLNVCESVLGSSRGYWIRSTVAKFNRPIRRRGNGIHNGSSHATVL